MFAVGVCPLCQGFFQWISRPLTLPPAQTPWLLDQIVKVPFWDMREVGDRNLEKQKWKMAYTKYNLPAQWQWKQNHQASYPFFHSCDFSGYKSLAVSKEPRSLHKQP